MTYTLKLNNAFVTMCYTDFSCPVCQYKYHEEDWFDKCYKSKYGLIYITCKGCKTKLGVTTNIKGDVVVWEKSKEEK